MSNIHFHSESNDEAHGEYTPHDGIIDVYLAGHMTIWGLLDTLNHEFLHQAIEESGQVTTEKQDHWMIQQLGFV